MPINNPEGSRPGRFQASPFPFFIISAVVFIIDQVTKYLVKGHLSPPDFIRVCPFFNIVYVENVGSAFGMFKGLGNVFFIIVAFSAMIVVSVLIVREREGRLGLSLVLGGAAGNLADRLVHGYVVDFLDVYVGRHHWPAFNAADSALTVGIAFLLVSALFPRK